MFLAPLDGFDPITYGGVYWPPPAPEVIKELKPVVIWPEVKLEKSPLVVKEIEWPPPDLLPCKILPAASLTLADKSMTY